MKKMAGPLLDDIYQSTYDEQIRSLLKESKDFGISLFGNGATILKTPIMVFLGSRPNNPFAMYQIGDLIARLSVNGQGFNYVNDTLYTMYSGIYCGSQNPYNACSPAVNVGLNPERGVIDDRNLPIWLKEGKQIAISALVPENYYNPPNLTQPYVRGSGTFITAIEFNIVP
jgi:hypothetical protein